MSGDGTLGLKLRFLVRWLRSRADSGVPLDAEELGCFADNIAKLLPIIEAMENRPIHPILTVIEGGAPRPPGAA